MSLSSVHFGSSPKNRRVFFSFHYDNDIFRVDQIRNFWSSQVSLSNRYGNVTRGVFDASIQEKSKRDRDESLKQLIRDNMNNTSVTCILAGSETCYRRWVRYEIAQSVIHKNALLVVYVHEVFDSNGMISKGGLNPLDFIGVYRAEDNRILFVEWTNGKWVLYSDYTIAVDLPRLWNAPCVGQIIQLSSYAKSYFYVSHNGNSNFANWVHEAANTLEGNHGFFKYT